MSRKKLYRRYELLEEIRKYPRASIRELCEAMDIRAPSQIHGLLRELEEEGLIVREPRLARSIQIGGVRRARSEMKARHCAISKNEKKGVQVQVRHSARGKQDKARLEANIERIAARARKAQVVSESGVDVMNDFRRPFGRHTLHAVKIG